MGFSSDKPSTGGFGCSHYSLTYNNGARCGERREVPTLEARAVNMGRRGQGYFHTGRAFIQAVRLTPGGQEPEGGGMPQKLPRSIQASEGSRR